MKSGFEKISLSRIFRIEELEQLDDESLVDVLFRDCRLEVWRLEESEEELVDELQMRPRGF